MSTIPQISRTQTACAEKRLQIALPCSSNMSAWMWNYNNQASSIQPDDKNGTPSYLTVNGQRMAYFGMTPTKAGEVTLTFFEVSSAPTMCGGSAQVIAQAEITLQIDAPTAEATTPATEKPAAFKPGF